MRRPASNDMRMTALALLALLAAAASPAAAQDQAQGAAGVWVTLGTKGGPIASASRSQPANVLVTQDGAYLVDVGDGAVEQLAKAEIPLGDIRAVLISHLHFDHTAGLLGVLGLRWQTNASAPLTIYGPPGTQEFVDGLLAAMQPTARSGYGLPGAANRPPAAGIEVIEIRDGAHFELGSVAVSTRKNTHYTFPPGSEDDLAFESLAFRFDLPGRSIAYTGDTGPSVAVEELAHDVDVLVVEMTDLERTIVEIIPPAARRPGGPMSDLQAHLSTHHLTPEEVGKMAAAAGAKSVVVTHLSGPDPDADALSSYVEEIGAYYRGPVSIGEDLDRY